MIYEIFSPSPVLSDVVEHYWYSKIDLKESIQQHYPTPLLQGLVFNFKNQVESHTYNNKTLTLSKSAYIFGQPVSPRVVTTDKKGIDILGVKFKPLGIPKITGIHMEYFTDSIIPVEDIWGKELDLLCDEMQSTNSLENSFAVLENFLIHKYLHTSLHYRSENTQHALALINKSNGNIRIKTLQEQTGTSRKTLERAFLNYVGIHPKLYTRIVRFNAVKDAIDKASFTKKISAASLDYGFYDVSHFISEFKHFAGCTPQDYLKNSPINLVYKDL